MTGDRVPLPPDLDACPLLGLPNDPSTHFAFAHRAHLCHATPRPASIDVTYQARFCLTAGFPACDRYRAWAAGVAATAGPPPEPEMVGVMESVAARVAAAQEAPAPAIAPAAEAIAAADGAFAPLTGPASPAGSASPAVALAASSLAQPPMAEPVVAEPLIQQPPVPEPTVAAPSIAELEVAEPPVAERLIAEPTVEQSIAEPTLAAPPVVEEPLISEPVIEEPPTSEPILAAPEIPEPEIIKPPSAEPSIAPPVDRPAAWRSLASAFERLSAARPKPALTEPLPPAASIAAAEPVVEPHPAAASSAAAEPLAEPLSPPPSTEPPLKTFSAATMEPQADLAPEPAPSAGEPPESTWVAVPMETTSSAVPSIDDPIESFLAASRAPIEPPSAPPLVPIPVADEDDADDDHVADEAQGVEPPTDFGVWSTPEEEVAADDESAPWSPVGDAAGSASTSRLAALNVWPAIRPLSSPEPRPAPPPAQRSLIGDDAWPPAPSLTSRSAGAATPFAAAVPAVPRSSVAASTGTVTTTGRAAPARPTGSAVRPTAPTARTEPVRPTLDAAALRRTRLPLLVVLLAIAIIAGFAAGPWALRQLTGGDVPTPSGAAGGLATAVPSAQPTVPPMPAASAAANPTATPLSSPQASARPAFYIVQKGDSMLSIANRFGTTVQRLQQLNHISDPNRIVVGQKILLPTN